MKKDKIFSRKKLIFKIFPVLLLLVLFLNSCSLSQVNFSPIPPPKPSAKLRVYVIAVTSDIPQAGFWKVSQEEYASRMARQTGRMLTDQGIYEVVPAADVRAALGDQKIAGWEWKSNDWALAKDAGKALHADYVLCFERSFKMNLQQDMTLFNLHTGRQFNVSNYLPHRLVNDAAIMEMVRINYRTLFRNAQSDFLQTALIKGGVSQGETKLAVTQPAKVLASKGKVKLKESQPTAEAKQLAFEKELEVSLLSKNKKQQGSQLVVYDFDATEQLRIVGMILTEALREELYNLGGFTLVNRENMVQVMEELKLQQSGLINEKQAIKLGEWMAASEAVTGKIAIIGQSSILQAKRIDIKTLNTIALGSLKCKAGEEDEFLDNMSELARKLAQLRKN